MPPDQPAHEHRNQRDRQDRCCCHRVGFGEGERREQATLLPLQRENRDEREGDNQEAQEQRRADLGSSIGDDAPARFAGQFGTGMILRPALQMLVSILDHDNRRIDHRADGDGDATQRHDVGIDPLQPHHDEGREYP